MELLNLFEIVCIVVALCMNVIVIVAVGTKIIYSLNDGLMHIIILIMK